MPKCVKCENEQFVLLPFPVGQQTFTSVSCERCQTIVTVLDGAYTVDSLYQSILFATRSIQTLQNNVKTLQQDISKIKKVVAPEKK